MRPLDSSDRLDHFKNYRPLMFTPAEWRYILEDPGFLRG
jgi:hypothetical protein